MPCVCLQCHRAKFPILDVPVVYREDLPREGKPLRPGSEDLGMFIVTDLVPRLKEQGMLQLGNKASTAVLFHVSNTRDARACVRAHTHTHTHTHTQHTHNMHTQHAHTQARTFCILTSMCTQNAHVHTHTHTSCVPSEMF